MDAELRAQIGVTVCNHVDALDCSDRVDVLQSFERLDRRADDDVVVRPWGVFGLEAASVSFVTNMRAHLRNSPLTQRRVLGFLHDGPRLFGIVHTGDLYSHDALIKYGRNQMCER